MSHAQNVVPFMVAPFSGEHPFANAFDHKYPFPFEDIVPKQFTFWGEEVSMGYDGHDGYDWLMEEGTPIKAVADGTVDFAGISQPFKCGLSSVSRIVDDEQDIRIRHVVQGDTYVSVYGHLSKILVEKGQEVKAGSTIGFSGNTGCSDGPHLHFEVQQETPKGWIVTDPYGWESAIADPWASNDMGIRSVNLWKEGKAPTLFAESELTEGNFVKAPVLITRVRYMGMDDRQNPINEFVELTLNMQVAPEGYYLGKHRLITKTGEEFTFPNDFFLEPSQPIRIHTGQGTNTQRDLYWGLSTGVWNNEGGCVRLLKPDGSKLFNYFYLNGVCN